MKINWTDKAIKSFELNIKWLIENWTDKEIINFINQTEQLIDRIKQNPYIYSQSDKKKSVRKGRVNAIVSMFYFVRPRKKEIDILLFWDNRQNPNNLHF
jgi:plasmid stabilization system protein ParE